MQTQRVNFILGSKLGSASTSRYMGTIKTNSQISNFDYHVIKYEEIIKGRIKSRLVELLGDHQVSSIDASV